MEEIEKLEEEQTEKLKHLLHQQEEQKRTENEALNKLREEMAVEEKQLEVKRAQKIMQLETAIKKAEVKLTMNVLFSSHSSVNHTTLPYSSHMTAQQL